MKFLSGKFRIIFPKKTSWIWEIIFMFSALAFLARMYGTPQIFPGDKVFNLLWIPILLTAPRYGFGPGLAAGMLAFVFQLVSDANGIPDRTYIEIAAESGGLAMPVLFLAAAVFLGSTRQKYLEKEFEMQVKLNHAEVSLSQIQKDLDTSNEIRSKLESRIVGETKTIRTLYESALKLESLDLNQIREGCLEIFRKHFDVKKASYYIVEDRHFVLSASVGWDEGRDTEAKSLIDRSVLKYALRAGAVVTVKELMRHGDVEELLGNEAKPYIMIPLSESRRGIDAVISIEAIDFLALNQANINMMGILADWTSKAIQNAVMVQHARIYSAHSDNEEISPFDLMEADLRKEYERAVLYCQPLSIAVLKLKKYGFMKPELQDLLKRTLISAIHNHKNTVDRVYRHRFEGIYLLICPMRDETDARALAESIDQKFRALCSSGNKSLGEMAFGVSALKDRSEGPDTFLKELLTEAGIH
ncbi:MAG: hypothetical protein KC649_02625 [Candidatus Omnitrophica bacterium]|nr:hypothetical protein [Candidatus Omnitrophota bacterium]